jgi:hypothetical protein
MAVSASPIKAPRVRDLRALRINSLDWLIITVVDHSLLLNRGRKVTGFLHLVIELKAMKRASEKLRWPKTFSTALCGAFLWLDHTSALCQRVKVR